MTNQSIRTRRVVITDVVDVAVLACKNRRVRRHLCALAAAQFRAGSDDESNALTDSTTVEFCGAELVVKQWRLDENRSQPAFDVILKPEPMETVEAATAYQSTFWFSRWLEHAARHRYRILTEMAYVITLGGGWASVRNVQKSVYYAVSLYDLAQEIDDRETMRKCRVFIGWAHLWAGRNGYAKGIFRREHRVAVIVEDERQESRCEAALYHLEANPEFQRNRNARLASDAEADAEAGADGSSNGNDAAPLDTDTAWAHLFSDDEAKVAAIMDSQAPGDDDAEITI
jgi:hypothetical protein